MIKDLSPGIRLGSGPALLCTTCVLGLFVLQFPYLQTGDDNGPSLIPPLLAPLFGHSVLLSLVSKHNHEETFLFVSSHSHLHVFVL